MNVPEVCMICCWFLKLHFDAVLVFTPTGLLQVASFSPLAWAPRDKPPLEQTWSIRVKQRGQKLEVLRQQWYSVVVGEGRCENVVFL
jgi:hypothetical protein